MDYLKFTLSKEQTFYIVGDLNNNTDGNGCNDTCPREIEIPGLYEDLPVKIIAKKAFKSQNITNVTFSSNLIEIQDEAFNNNSLSSVALPSTVESLGFYCFASNSLTSFYIPSHVKFIGYSPLGSNRNMTQITVANDNPYFCIDMYGSLLNKQKTILIQSLPTIEFLIIPSSVHTIYQQALDVYSIFETIIITGDIKDFRFHAFQFLNQLTEVYYYGTTPIPQGSINIKEENPNITLYVCKDYEGISLNKVNISIKEECECYKYNQITCKSNNFSRISLIISLIAIMIY